MTDRYKDINGYRMDRWMFQAGMWLCLFWLLFVAWSYNFELTYFECPVNHSGQISGPSFVVDDINSFNMVNDRGECLNPFYKPVTWKNIQYLPPGEYGSKFGPLFQSVYYVPLLIFGLVFFLNHRIHNNKGRQKDGRG